MTSYESWYESSADPEVPRCYVCGSANVVNRVDEDASTGYRDEVPWCMDHNGRAD